MFQFHPQAATKQTCTLLAVTCGTSFEQQKPFQNHHNYPFPELVSMGRLEVQTLSNPEKEQFCKILESYQPNIVYLQGEQLANGKVGSLVWQGVELSTPEAITELFDPTLPTAVYLEIPNGKSFAEALHFKGIPYVIYWRNIFSCYAACHFCQAFLSVVQSSSTNTWDAFHLALASFEIYCGQNNRVLPDDSHYTDCEMGPHLLGNCLRINVDPPEMGEEDNEEKSSGSLPDITIHDDEVNSRFLICGAPSTVDESLMRSLEDGLRALLTIEIRGCKLHGKFSAPPPPLQAAAFSRGVVTMRCDISTCSSAHISLLVSGSAQTLFSDQLLESHIKNEIIEKSQLVHVHLNKVENKQNIYEPHRSAAIACGAIVFEISMKLPQWALQILRQLAPDVSYRSLVVLGIASIQGLPIASFEKDDAERLLFFYQSCEKDSYTDNIVFSNPPGWLKPPPPIRKRCEPSQGDILGPSDGFFAGEGAVPKVDEEEKDRKMVNGSSTPITPARQRLKVSAMRPIPHVHRHRLTPFCGPFETNGFDGAQVEANLPLVAPTKRTSIGSTSATHRKSFAASAQSKQVISLNPLPLKKHDCGRGPVQTCSEEEFLKDVMEFLILCGHSRLIPQGGLTEFPDAILNGKRLDLYNLYKEVVTRGGFHVGNGINWKGQIFSKMRNYTSTNRMTGVGNTLKRHYETYLLEYELAHDDVDGECCLLCHSSAAGDWVNCGICGEWAHFGCDRRQGLGAFKDYAKTDGLDYICPHCSVTNFKKQSIANGYSQGSMSSRPLS
ncbi:putative chromatin regulator PHD family [Lupinus albus]|uniref:Putative chromatin regulator PHD family n=1 Tax=Lupinus albus TaxID=3870 RepID=A0A6A4P8X1_LUPAL|nr:putative chromatin regulator PHD family [Lupinus albus]